MARKKDDGELSEQEREAFLKSVTKDSTSPEDARHLRGVAGALAVGIVLFGGDFLAFWKLGGFDDGQSSGSGLRGVAMLVMVQLTFAAWVYRRLSARAH